MPRVHPSAASPIGISEQIRRDELDLVQVWSLTILSLVLVKYQFTSLLRENIDLYGFCNRFHALVLTPRVKCLLEAMTFSELYLDLASKTKTIFLGVAFRMPPLLTQRTLRHGSITGGFWHRRTIIAPNQKYGLSRVSQERAARNVSP